MNSKIKHSIASCLMAFALPLLVACGSGNETLPPDDNTAALLLNIEPVGGSRAGVSDLPDNEKMQSLRVVVLHPDGTVEHNSHYTLDGAQTQQTIILKVDYNETKKVFLFANEESISDVKGVAGAGRTLTDFFSGYNSGDSGFEEEIIKLYFTPGYSSGTAIPMSSVYEIEVPATVGLTQRKMYVVRAATKFTVNFSNLRSEPVTVKSFSIAKHADQNYLMAHVVDSEQNRLLFNGKSWIEWLKDVSEQSSVDDDYGTTEAAGWLKDYELPDQANNNCSYTHTSVLVNACDGSRPGQADVSPVFYLPESKNRKSGATDGEQEYTMTLEIDGYGTESFTLPNLKSLFRNTHVIINITMDQTGNSAVIFVRQWNEITHEQIIL